MEVSIHYITLILLLFICSCEATKNSCFQSEEVEFHFINDLELEGNLPDGIRKIIMTNDSDKTTLEIDAGTIVLDADINRFSLAGINFIQPDSLGELIMLNYYYTGASGYAGGVINTIFISIRPEGLMLLARYNSFYGGMQSLSCYDGKMSIKIFDLVVNDSLKEEYYCSTTFVIEDEKITSTSDSKCWNLDAEGNYLMREVGDCQCVPVKTPFVF